MKTTQFERLFKNFIEKESKKSVSFDNLNREEKIDYLLQSLDIDTSSVFISTEKEMDIAKLSKDIRFEQIQKATAAQNFDLIAKLAKGEGFVNIVCSVPFEKSSIAAQLNYLEKEYQKLNGSLPDKIEVDILGGENFEEFIKFCYERINSVNESK